MLAEKIAQSTEALNQPEVSFHREWYPVTRVTMRELAEQVCVKHGITVAELKGERKLKRLIPARYEFMALAYELPHTSYPMIGRFLGGRDHTTVRHGVMAHWKRVGQ